jgi:peptidoglycan hydrolase FlgJ
MIDSPAVLPPRPPAATDPLRRAAEALEAQFLADMLRASGIEDGAGGFGGGAGEAQFRSFLTDQQAEAMVRAGGIGLAEHLFAALADRVNG